MFERDEDEERDEFMRAFEAFDAGELTSANAHEFELPEPPAKKESDGGASGADQAERGGQQTGKADSDAATGAEQDKTASRERGRDGRFAKGAASDQPAAAGQKPQAAPNADATAQQPKATDAQASATQPEPAPEGISARAAAVWATATPETRAYIRETEGVLERVADGFKPIFEEAKQHKLPWNQYAERLVKADRYLRSSPQDAMLWLAETHGIDLDELADFAAAKRVGMVPQQQRQAPELHRVVQPLADEVKEIRSQLAQREQFERQQAERMASERRAAAKREYDAFAAKAEHWSEVESSVIQAIPILRAAKPDASVTEILQAAYDTAAWSNPAVREKLLAAQQRKAQDVGRSQRSRTIESVTSHAGAPSVTSRKPSNGATSDPLRDEIAAHWDAYESR